MVWFRVGTPPASGKRMLLALSRARGHALDTLLPAGVAAFSRLWPSAMPPLPRIGSAPYGAAEPQPLAVAAAASPEASAAASGALGGAWWDSGWVSPSLPSADPPPWAVDILLMVRCLALVPLRRRVAKTRSGADARVARGWWRALAARRPL